MPETEDEVVETPVVDETPAEPKPGAEMRLALKAAKDEAAKFRAELDGYKRRDEEARKAQLSKEQQLEEALKARDAEIEAMRGESLRNKIASEFKLPAALAARLIGSDEAALRADAEELSTLIVKPRVGTATNPSRETATPRTYTRSELRNNPALAASAEVMQAAREGRILNQ